MQSERQRRRQGAPLLSRDVCAAARAADHLAPWRHLEGSRALARGSRPESRPTFASPSPKRVGTPSPYRTTAPPRHRALANLLLAQDVYLNLLGPGAIVRAPFVGLHLTAPYDPAPGLRKGPPLESLTHFRIHRSATRLVRWRVPAAAMPPQGGKISLNLKSWNFADGTS